MSRDSTRYPVRRRQRLLNYDYRTPGYYFITLCIQERLPLLGRVIDGVMQESPAGTTIRQLWEEIPTRYPGVELDTFILLPDHLHAIIVLTAVDADASDANRGEERPVLSLSELIHHLKARTTARYAIGVRESAWPRFRGRLWQRGYFERVIRQEEELRKTREYVRGNVLRWTLRDAAR